ncbi:DUF2834 domain-containing protein [Solimonas terrae]|uniref:DUF2834 domain-containing protein n=1 Tax=Solimonas terrae TaxID=1396819 RepID=A0A6M2BSZ8_9GAMM|nr:DUF2834 domain-containing protein [Solimonas terrae]NGY05736.1 DUF2834 domain-containing protein [Solimonas terrae]
MSTALFRALVAVIGALFTLAFFVIVVPPLVHDPDVIGAFAAGFVNPFASGYSLDTVACWCLLAVWVSFEARAKGIRHGWIALVLGVVPGVAAGLSVYLLMRLGQERGGGRRA